MFGSWHSWASVLVQRVCLDAQLDEIADLALSIFTQSAQHAVSVIKR